MSRAIRQKRWGAALLLGAVGSVIIALGQRSWDAKELSPGARRRGQTQAAESSGARAGSIMETTVLSLGKAGADWGSDDLRDAVAGAPAAARVSPGAFSSAKAPSQPAGEVPGEAAAKAVGEFAGEAEGFPKGGGKQRKGKKEKASQGVEDPEGGPEARPQRGSRGGARGGRGAASDYQKSAAGKVGARGSQNSRAGAGGFYTAAGRRRGSGRARSSGSSGAAGSAFSSARGSGRTRRARGRRGRGGGAGDEGADYSGGGAAFSRGSTRSRGRGAGGSGARGAGKSRSGRGRGGGHSGGGGGGDDAGDDSGAPSAHHGKGGKDKKGGGRKGGGGGGGTGGRDGSRDEGGKHKHGPILTRDTEGWGTPHPPNKDVPLPDFAGLDKKIPERAGDGSPIKPAPSGFGDIESIRPPQARPEPGSDPAKFGWRGVGGVAYYCNASACGRWADSHWIWMRQNEKGRWWIRSYSPGSDGALAPDSPAYLRHQGHWWWKDDAGSWSVVHEGDPWSYRYLVRWKQEGLVHEGSGTHIIYTSDGNVMVVEPGKGAIVYDPATGKVIGRKKAGELPKSPLPEPLPSPVL